MEPSGVIALQTLEASHGHTPRCSGPDGVLSSVGNIPLRSSSCLSFRIATRLWHLGRCVYVCTSERTCSVQSSGAVASSHCSNLPQHWVSTTPRRQLQRATSRGTPKQCVGTSEMKLSSRVESHTMADMTQPHFFIIKKTTIQSTYRHVTCH